MSYYLDRLKKLNSEKRLPTDLPKLPKPPFGSFDSSQGARFQKTDTPAPVVGAGDTATASMTADEEAAIRAWLAYVGETDPEQIDDVLRMCRSNPASRAFYLARAAENSGSAHAATEQAVHVDGGQIKALATAFYDHLFGPGAKTGCCKASVARYCDEGLRLRDAYYRSRS